MNRIVSLIAVGIVLMGWSVDAVWADSALFSFSSGTRAAEVEFEKIGDDLQVTLTNTSLHDVLEPVDVLTAVYFDIAGNPVLTAESAMLADASIVIQDDAPPGGNVGGEWAFRQGLAAGELPDDQAYGLSSTGIGVFGPGDLIDPLTPLAHPASPNGLEYGILSLADDFDTGNGGVKNEEGLIHNSVQFLLSGIPSGFDYSSISNVRFQYGTSLSEPNFSGSAIATVPEPTSLSLLATGALGFIGYGWRRKRMLAV